MKYSDSGMWACQLLNSLLEIVGSEVHLLAIGLTSFESVGESRCAIGQAAATLRRAERPVSAATQGSP